MTMKDAWEVCGRIHSHWPRLALKSRNAAGKPEWTERAKDWAAAFKKVAVEAMHSAISYWFRTQDKEPTYKALVREAMRLAREAQRPTWADRFDHGDILVDPRSNLIGILDKQVGAVWREVTLVGRLDNRPYWAVLCSFRDLHDSDTAIFARLERCPAERAQTQLALWQVADLAHWQFDVPRALWVVAERLLKQRS